MKLSILTLAPAMAALSLASAVSAQGPGGGAPAGPPPTAKTAGGQDLTGQWVSVVTEDWRWRMVTPAKGDFSSVPMTPAARTAAYAWNLAADNAAGNQCRAYGAAAIMRVPTRIRIAWADDSTLKLETDAGQQTRLFKFIAARPGGQLPALTAPTPPPAERTWQGDSKAQWFKQPQSVTFGPGGGGGPGVLRVVTRNMRAGYLRKNGVPYSQDAVVTEQFNRHDEPNGDSWITVTTIVEDPQNLQQPFIVSTDFKKEADASKWNPQACQTLPPLEKDIPPPAPRGGGAGAAPAAAAPAAKPAARK